MNIGRIQLYLVSHPDLIEHVLITDNDRFAKPWLLRRAADVLGQGLLTSDGSLWKRQRQLMQPAFHRSRILAYTDVMTRRTEALMERWTDGDLLDVHAHMMKLTLGIVAETLFGAEVENRADTVAYALDIALRRFVDQLSPLRALDRLPLPRNVRFRRAVRLLDSIIYDMIESRRSAGAAGRGDLLSILLGAQDEEGGGMTDQQLRDEVVTLFLAGHETTAIALSWTWHLLSLHPDVERRLHEEVDGVLAGRTPTIEDLPELRFTEMVFKESMRLYPPAWRIGREVVDEVQIGGYRLPVGAQVLMSQWIVHRDPRFFTEPLEFRPDRWREPTSALLPRFAYFPFGGGGRRCIGDHFALLEGVVVLAAIAQRFRLVATDPASVVPFATITLRPRNGVPVRLERRPRRAA